MKSMRVYAATFALVAGPKSWPNPSKCRSAWPNRTDLEGTGAAGTRLLTASFLGKRRRRTRLLSFSISTGSLHDWVAATGVGVESTLLMEKKQGHCNGLRFATIG